MPRKVRQLEADLRVSGFVFDPDRGKGSHRWWVHPTGVKVNLAGNPGADAKPYQEKEIREAIRKAREREAGAKEQQP